ncbi:MAG: nucleotidyltransferase family protein [Hyphomicrobiaceae bacterium]|nr:nucleotidyltransferase family protein [Hyphomicrobiaceae bacterium]
MSRPTTAMVLAAGLGNRMRPLTDVVPKPMVRLGDRPLIDHVLDRLASAGISRAVVNVHYLADVLEHHLAGRTTPPRITISDERDKLLDTGGGLVRALPLLGSEPFLIHNSDSVWLEGPHANLEALIETWDAERMDSLLLLASSARTLGYDGAGDFNMDVDGRLKRRAEGMVTPFVFTGVSIAHPRLFDNATGDIFSLNRLWDRAIDKGRLYGIRLDGFWMHVGTPQALAAAEECLKYGEPRPA